MKNYNNYYFFKLIFDSSHNRGYLRYRVEKNSNFGGFTIFNNSIKIMSTLDSSVTDFYFREGDGERLSLFVNTILTKYKKQYMHNSLFLNKYIRDIYSQTHNKLTLLLAKLEHSQYNQDYLFASIQKELSQLLKKTIIHIKEYINLGENFLLVESKNSFLFVDTYIANYNLKTLELDLTFPVFKDKNLNTLVFVEICQYYKNSYIPNFESQLNDLQDKLVKLFYKFKTDNTFTVLKELDVHFLLKNKLIQEHELFYSTAPNFLVTLIEKFRDSSKNIKQKIILTKKFIINNNSLKNNKTKIKFHLEKYLINLFAMKMDNLLKIRKHEFVSLLRRIQLTDEVPEVDLTIPYDYICLIYKGVIKQIDLKLKINLYPLTKGNFNKNYKLFILNRDYLANRKKYNQHLAIYSNHEFFSIKNSITLLSRKYKSLYQKISDHGQKIPFSVVINYIEDIYLIEDIPNEAA